MAIASLDVITRRKRCVRSTNSTAARRAHAFGLRMAVAFTLEAAGSIPMRRPSLPTRRGCTRHQVPDTLTLPYSGGVHHAFMVAETEYQAALDNLRANGVEISSKKIVEKV